MRRLFDLVASTVGLLLLSPLFVVLAAAIKLEDGGPVFFGQVRVGRHMRKFTLWKFRTMVTDAEIKGGPITTVGDERVTRIGAYMRRHRLDELPQLFNVIRGDLSIVGARPELPLFVEMFREEYSKILVHRPGITDPASVQFRNQAELLWSGDYERVYVKLILPAKLCLSLDYAQRRSFLSDLAFISRTIGELLHSRSNPMHPRFSRSGRISRAFSGAMQFIETQPWVERYVASVGGKIAIDVGVTAIALISAHLLRFDGWPPGIEAERMWRLLPFVVGGRILTNYFIGIYRRIWRFTSLEDGILLGMSASVTSLVLLFLRFWLAGVAPYLTVPIGIIVIDYVLANLGMDGVRLIRRISNESRRRRKFNPIENSRHAVLAGAREAGIMAVREIIRRPELGIEICGFVDDWEKPGEVVQGVPVLGKIDDLPLLTASRRIDLVIITMTNAPRKKIRHIVEVCEAAGLPVKIVPGLYEVLGGKVTISKVRPVEIEDLLGRDAINFQRWLTATKSFYSGKRILVTGAGGSIGRELCRQLVALSPEEIVLVDKDENAVFESELELRGIIGDGALRLSPVIGNLKIAFRLNQVFDRYRPAVVFHAAAHKHVPMMEKNSIEAVLNNVLGTRVLLRVCAEYGVERCVMVSTDKAVNPTSIMGATKRVAELLFQAQAARLNGKAHYSCVRFGNVLGSRGSVIPIFRDQIKAGGPVTVTDPEMVRYFMTIPEAAQLIIQAGALGEKGEIFLLDMGEPVKMIDLVKDMIRLSGLTLGEDIEIKVVGARPGEKLREELLIAEEGATATQYDKIFVAPPLHYDYELLDKWVDRLTWATRSGDEARIYKIFYEMGIGFQGRGPAASVAIESMQ